MSRYQQLEGMKTSMLAYLKIKVDEQNWKAVVDAAMDLLQIESEKKGILELQPFVSRSYRTDAAIPFFETHPFCPPPTIPLCPGCRHNPCRGTTTACKEWDR